MWYTAVQHAPKGQYNSETWGRLGNAVRVPRIATHARRGVGQPRAYPHVTSDERCIISCNVCACLGRGGHPRAEHWEPFFESIDLNTWKGLRICVSRTVHIRSRLNITLQYILEMFSGLNFVCIFRLFPVCMSNQFTFCLFGYSHHI
jgi:hypothetical protein